MELISRTTFIHKVYVAHVAGCFTLCKILQWSIPETQQHYYISTGAGVAETHPPDHALSPPPPPPDLERRNSKLASQNSQSDSLQPGFSTTTDIITLYRHSKRSVTDKPGSAKPAGHHSNTCLYVESIHISVYSLLEEGTSLNEVIQWGCGPHLAHPGLCMHSSHQRHWL